jgi:hypothetical protein
MSSRILLPALLVLCGIGLGPACSGRAQTILGDSPHIDTASLDSGEPSRTISGTSGSVVEVASTAEMPALQYVNWPDGAPWYIAQDGGWAVKIDADTVLWSMWDLYISPLYPTSGGVGIASTAATAPTTAPWNLSGRFDTTGYQYWWVPPNPDELAFANSFPPAVKKRLAPWVAATFLLPDGNVGMFYSIVEDAPNQNPYIIVHGHGSAVAAPSAMQATRSSTLISPSTAASYFDWGGLVDGGYVYGYSAEQSATLGGLDCTVRVGRAPVADYAWQQPGNWEFWTGDTWSGRDTDAAAVAHHVGGQLRVSWNAYLGSYVMSYYSYVHSRLIVNPYGYDTTLDASVGPTDSALTVANAAYFHSPSGTVLIDDEQISYGSVQNNSLTGLIRGADGTVPAAHAAGTVARLMQPTGSLAIRLAPTPWGRWGDEIALVYPEHPGAGFINYGGLEQPDLSPDGGQTNYFTFTNPLNPFGLGCVTRLYQVKFQTSASPSATSTPTATPTFTAANTPTTAALTPTSTRTAANTPTRTATSTETPTPVTTPTPTPTRRPAVKPTDAPTAKPAPLTATPALSPAAVPPGTPNPDADGDGVPGTSDNCPQDFNPAQSDIDGNGVGDLCDEGTPAPLALSWVRLRAAPAGSISIRAKLDGREWGSLPQALAGGVTVGVIGVGLPQPEVFQFPSPRCIALSAAHIVCVGSRGESASFVRRSTGSIFSVNISARYRAVPPVLRSDAVQVVLSMGALDRRDTLGNCRVQRTGTFAICKR